MKNLYIPEPCSENWESMSPQEKGRFCSVCKKCVIDFTQKQPQEIQQIIQEKKEEGVCGRFYNHQLNMPHPSEKLKERFFEYIPSYFQNNKIVLTLFSLVLFLIGCSKPKEEVCMTTGFVDVIEEDSAVINKEYTMGEPIMIDNDTVAKIPKKDSAIISRNHNTN
ncbi:hypothetical protein BBH99_10030 [Chryseobacterium contaminans]|uniref:Uncharacterized protein n=1 Tax=Chryseobacterium contaminans TaxID=1423959 RepID=A0A1M7GHL0_9FLAO|nr:hypothetical protein [Chryseobacterium contaminans]OCA77990.1 hypothetical protein BBH99_10030 [Chryseobacterium contaminans]SHM15615.1 hypothetical protein SAMN05444407_11042 [Chryseobacterium contaminans]